MRTLLSRAFGVGKVDCDVAGGRNACIRLKLLSRKGKCAPDLRAVSVEFYPKHAGPRSRSVASPRLVRTDLSEGTTRRPRLFQGWATRVFSPGRQELWIERKTSAGGRNDMSRWRGGR